jgi:hypothetical protein
MSSSHPLALLSPSRLTTVHPLAGQGNIGTGTQQTVLLYDDQGNAFMGSTNVQMDTGPEVDTGVSVTIRNTYPARYNFAVNQFNFTASDGIPRKKYMRGGHFLMYRSVTILSLFIALAVGGISSILKPIFEDSSKWKPFLTLNIVICLIYIILSIYNIIIFKRNGSLINNRMIYKRHMKGSNEHVKIPVYTSVTQTNALVSEQEQIAAGLQNVSSHVNEVSCMYYSEYYVKTYTHFPRTTVKHIIAFLLAMTEGIVLTIMI